MGEGWVGVCAKVHMWRSAGGHLWGVGCLFSLLVLRRCDLAEHLHLPRRPLPWTPALFVSHGLPLSKVPPFLHILAAFLPFIFMYHHMSCPSSLMYSFPSPFLCLAILCLNGFTLLPVVNCISAEPLGQHAPVISVSLQSIDPCCVLSACSSSTGTQPRG